MVSMTCETHQRLDGDFFDDLVGEHIGEPHRIARTVFECLRASLDNTNQALRAELVRLLREFDPDLLMDLDAIVREAQEGDDP